MKLILIFIYTALAVTNSFAQKKDPDEILQRVVSEFNKVEDYTVDVEISVDISFLKMPDRKAKIYFKQPDKVHIESDAFTILPKQAIRFSPQLILGDSYTALYEREEKINGVNATVIKVIPLNQDTDVILTTLWVDTKRNVIVKIESSVKPTGTFEIEMNYLKTSQGYLLPDSIKISFETGNIFIPPNLTDESNKEEQSGNSGSSKKGKVYLHYSNYKINQNLPDSLFTGS